MSVRYAQRWRLRRLDRRIRQADPQLAAMLAVFARVHAGEAIASERLGWRDGPVVTQVRRAFGSLGNALAHPRPGWENSWLGINAGQAGPHADRKYG